MDLSYLNKLPDGIRKLFGVPKAIVCRIAPSVCRSVPGMPAASAFYQGMVQDPDKVLSFPARVKDANGNLTNQTITQRFTVGGLMDLAPGWQGTTARLQAIYDRARDISVERVLTPEEQTIMLTGQWVGGENERQSQSRSIHLANTRGCLDIPATQDPRCVVDHYNTTNKRTVPTWFPVLNDSAPVVSLTPAVLNRQGVPTARLEALYVDGWSAIFNYLKDRNAVMLFHSLVMGARQNIQVPYGYHSSFSETALQNYRDWNGTPAYLLISTILGFTIPDGDPTQGPQFGGPLRGWWRESLDRRVPILNAGERHLSRGQWNDSESKLSTPVSIADATLELARMLNVMKVLLATGNANIDARATMVDLFNVQACYGGIQTLAYQQIDRPYGSNVIGYRANMAMEIQARINQARTDAVGVPGYHSSGDDAADLSMALVGCVALAVSAGAAAGGGIQGVVVGIVAFVLAGLRLMVAWLSLPDAPRSPYDLPIRLDGSRGPQAFGVSVINALEMPPAFRVNGR